MNYVPAIYFSILSAYLLKNRGIDASSYISLIYTATSILAVAIDIMGLAPNLVSFASLLPTIIYCILLTLFIIPVAVLDFNSFDGIKFHSQKLLRYINYIFFAAFLSYVFAYSGDLKYIMTYGDFGELKGDVYTGEGYQLTKYSTIVELFLYPMRIIANASMIMIFIFFFNITFLKEKWWINLMAILGSTTVIMIGILVIDRSTTFFWVLILGLALATFWQQMSSKIKSIAIGFSAALILVAASYAMSVTKDRFEERDGGSEGGIVLYLGQPYYHFCEIWDYYPAPDGITTKSLFSFFHKFVMHDFEGPVAYQAEMGLKSNMNLGVFYTHLGSFMLTAGNFGPFMITFTFLIVFYFLYFNEDEDVPIRGQKVFSYLPFEKLMILYFLLIIPTIGCITYIYENFYMEPIIYLTIFALYFVKDDDVRIINMRK